MNKLINCINSGSSDNAHIFCMYKGVDIMENMLRASSVFLDQLVDLQMGDFSIDNNKYYQNYFGDMKYLEIHVYFLSLDITQQSISIQ